ncbi:retinol dehydrogenase 10-A-like [Ceratina calcarata]|uniref:Retinol dehydrogenase 10-A-like n=1 Tax=Ceratina calcarata TaxID=156304 RepID=A0AAJ7WB56_9HYME|nr:retinol dehydrogenase 10-A-like [Ceratina calcarata]XP_017881176.1 retinol dehydrogenase 10-A-like [Ceratina calcarata]XP_026669908.1 retinol dehydrogenase 10-A-like [Ceratina calcarata]
MFCIRNEIMVTCSRTGSPSSTVWLFLTIEFLIGIFLSVFLAILTVIKSLLPKPPRDLTGDVVLIVGASSSLGESLTEEFVKNGCSVVCVDSNSKLIEENVSKLRKQYQLVEKVDTYRKNDSSVCRSAINSYECNLEDKDDIRRLAQKVKDDIGRVDILVTCVGDSNQDIFDTASRTLMSHFWTVLAFLPLMLYQERARIVGVTPVASNSDAYHGSRAAIVSLMESLCQELSNHTSHLAFLAFSPIAECRTLKQSEERIAKNIVRAVKTDQNDLNISWMSRLLYKLSCMTYRGITLLTQWVHSQGCDHQVSF